MGLGGVPDSYPECNHIPKSRRLETKDEELLRLRPNEDEGVLPLFERKISNYKREKLCSLQTNELLQCRWRSFVRSGEMSRMEHSPFKFPDVGHLHFNNYAIKYMPAQSPKSWKTFKMHLKVGPGVDHYGQMPIPDDMHLHVSQTIKPKERPKALKCSKATKCKH